MKLLVDLLNAFNHGISHVKANAWYIFLLLVTVYIVKDQGV